MNLSPALLAFAAEFFEPLLHLLQAALHVHHPLAQFGELAFDIGMPFAVGARRFGRAGELAVHLAGLLGEAFGRLVQAGGVQVLDGFAEVLEAGLGGGDLGVFPAALPIAAAALPQGVLEPRDAVLVLLLLIQPGVVGGGEQSRQGFPSDQIS